MTFDYLELGELVIEIRRKPIKNIHLRIYPPDGQVKVSAPQQIPLDTVKKFIETKRDWIYSQRIRCLKLPSQAVLNFESGEQYLYLGTAHTLKLYQSVKQKIVIEPGTLHCHFKPDSLQTEKQKFLDNWLRQQMNFLLSPLIAKWQSIIGVQVGSWGVRVMKTRWGSCNPTKKRIWLNLNLIKKNIICMEYVLIHEMVHLLEASHNKRFYAFMDQFLPQWRDIQKLLEAS